MGIAVTKLEKNSKNKNTANITTFIRTYYQQT